MQNQGCKHVHNFTHADVLTDFSRSVYTQSRAQTEAFKHGNLKVHFYCKKILLFQNTATLLKARVYLQSINRLCMQTEQNEEEKSDVSTDDIFYSVPVTWDHKPIDFNIPALLKDNSSPDISNDLMC